MKLKDLWDCVIIGGGPAGLTAGLYLARYLRKVIIYDTFNSRAERIPLSHNYPGFPKGISGAQLLNKLRLQLSSYQVPLVKEAVKSLRQLNKKEFLIQTANSQISTRNIILATGVNDVEPPLANIHDGIQRGLLRYCPVCDAYEVINKKIAIIGNGSQGLNEALFLRDYTEEITLITFPGEDKWTKKELKMIQEMKINIISIPIKAIELCSNFLSIRFSDEHIISYDSIYSALGSIKNNNLAIDLKLKLKNGCIIVDKNQQTSLKGVFAAGDIVSGLNQLCVATSQAAIAATEVHARCRKRCD